jgi:hypothetical protein
MLIPNLSDLAETHVKVEIWELFHVGSSEPVSPRLGFPKPFPLPPRSGCHLPWSFLSGTDKTYSGEI